MLRYFVCGSFSHDTVGARSKSFPQTQTTYVFISRLAWNWNMAHGNLELLRSGKLPASSWRDGLNRLTWTRLGLKGRMHVIHKLWQITLDVKEEKITFRLWFSNLNMFWLQLTVLDVFVCVIIQKKYSNDKFVSSDLNAFCYALSVFKQLSSH